MRATIVELKSALAREKEKVSAAEAATAVAVTAVVGSGLHGKADRAGAEDPEMVDRLRNQLEQLAMSKESEVRWSRRMVRLENILSTRMPLAIRWIETIAFLAIEETLCQTKPQAIRCIVLVRSWDRNMSKKS